MHEKSPLEIIDEFDEKESKEFLDIWKEEFAKNKNLNFSDIIQDWNMWYKEIDLSIKIPLLKDINPSQINEEKKVSKKAFYRYPDSLEPEKIFDFDDLGDNTLVIGCFMDIKEEKYSCYIYKTYNFLIEEDVKKILFVGKIKFYRTSEN